MFCFIYQQLLVGDGGIIWLGRMSEGAKRIANEVRGGKGYRERGVSR